MPTIFTHVAVPLALAACLGSRMVPRRLLAAGALAAILPDLDVVGFRLGIAYSDALGHRGASHSFFFALLLACIAYAAAPGMRCRARAAAVFVGVCAASHGLLDMFTNGGLGIALWWPFSDERLFASWRMIEVSPLSLRGILSGRGLAVLQSELLWVWLPTLVVCLSAIFVQRRNGDGRLRNTQPGSGPSHGH